MATHGQLTTSKKSNIFGKCRHWIIIFGIFIILVSLIQFISFSQKKIIVAIVDTGLDLKQTKFWIFTIEGYNILNSRRSPQDDNGHGTQVASVMHFLEPRIKILPIKAIPKSGITTKQDLAKGIIVAVNRGAKIINVSAGVVSPSLDLENAVKYAEANGVIIIAAAGGNGEGIEYPAAYNTVLAVGGIDNNGNILENSNIGYEMDFVALGDYKTIGLRGECLSGAGTSLAAPIVSVYVAKIFLNKPNITTEKVRDTLLEEAIDIGKPGRDEITGYGLIKLEKNVSDICK